jgi:sulfate permease, SulP family
MPRLRSLRTGGRRQDALAGLVLGVQSVPDGLATGLLAGVNPMAGLYGYMVGTATGALLTSSAFMAVQGTGAMAMVVADVPAIAAATDPTRALSRRDVGRALAHEVPRRIGMGPVGVREGRRDPGALDEADEGERRCRDVLQGMPVGGSVSASSLNKEAGARSRRSLLVAALVMAVVVVALGEAVGRLAMPALAGLLMLIGLRTVKPADLQWVWKTGAVQKVVVGVTFVLTMLVPLQYAVLVGVGLSIVLHVVRQSQQITIRRQVVRWDGQIEEADAPAELPGGEIVVLQPYGSLFFAAAPVFEAALPAIGETSSGSVVILRLRGRTDLGTTFLDGLLRYATALTAVGSTLMVVSVSDRVLEQLTVTGITDVIGADHVHAGDDRLGWAFAQAHADATAWLERRRT